MGCECNKKNLSINEENDNQPCLAQNMIGEKHNQISNITDRLNVSENVNSGVRSEINNDDEMKNKGGDRSNLISDVNSSAVQKSENYAEKMLILFNIIRQNPSEYAKVVLESIQNIYEDPQKTKSSKTKVIYKKKVKVALIRGAAAFKEAAEELRNLEPVAPLEFKNELCIPLPETVEEVRDSSFLKRQVANMGNKDDIIVYFKDLVKVPEVSALLMIVDDNGKNAGKKRLSVLNGDFKYVGISSKFIGKTFVAYFAFSK